MRNYKASASAECQHGELQWPVTFLAAIFGVLLLCFQFRSFKE